MKSKEKYLKHSPSLSVLFGKPIDQLADVWDFVCTVCQHMTLQECYSRGLEYAFDIVDKLARILVRMWQEEEVERRVRMVKS